MEIGQYEKRRKELVEYIDTALALPRVSNKTAEILTAVRKKIFENQFRIVLISGFETGKSTTFNAICEGQEISPRGAMLRTSATVISAQNTADEALANKASVIWRSDKELTLIFSKYLLKNFKQLDEHRFGKLNQSDQLAECLRYPDDLSLLQKAVTLRKSEITTMISEISSEEHEALRMADLIGQLYNSPLLQQIKAIPVFSINDVEKMVRFPLDWSKGNDSQEVNAEDYIFLFVKEAHVYIKSDSLKRTGSVLIDCPGLFASSYDTRVAFDILENADAVWYILNGSGMGEEDIACAKSLVTAKPDRIFYTVNMFHNTKTNVENNIIPSYINSFKKLGVNLTDTDFMPYHALLALIAIQAEKYINKTLDKDSEKAIYRLAKRFGTQYKDFEDLLTAWTETILCSVFGYTVRQLKNFDLFASDLSGIKLISEICGMKKVLNVIENSVIRQKAYSILVENGSRKTIELLKQLEADLKVEEKVALEAEEQMEDEFDAARKSLDDFQTFCDTELNVLRDTAIDHALALDYWQEVIVSSIDEVALASAQKIAAVNCNEIRQEENEQIINDTFAEIVLPKASAWADNIRNGSNATFNSLLSNKISKIIESTDRHWQQTIQAQPMLAGLPTPTPIIGSDVIGTEFIDSIVAKTPGVSGEVVTGAAACMAIGILLGSFVFPGIGGVLGGAIGSIIGAVWGNGVGSVKREKLIYEAIQSELSKNVVIAEHEAEAENQSVIQKQGKRIKALRIGIIKAFEDAFEDTKNAFEVRQNRALQMFRIQTMQREKLAAEHKKLREEKIEPLQRKLRLFENAIRKEYY